MTDGTTGPSGPRCGRGARAPLRRGSEKGFDYGKLDAASQLQYRVFLDEQQLLLDRYRWRDHFYALNQIVGLHIDVPGTLTGSQLVETEVDALAYIRRIEAVAPAFRQLIRNMQRQANKASTFRSPYIPADRGCRERHQGRTPRFGCGQPHLCGLQARVAKLDIPTSGKPFDRRSPRGIDPAAAAAYEQLIRLLKAQSAQTSVSAAFGDCPTAMLLRVSRASVHHDGHDSGADSRHGLAEMARPGGNCRAHDRLGFTAPSGNSWPK